MQTTLRSQSVEDYLKAIYLIQEQQGGGSVSTSSLAAYLGISSASVTGMLKRFAAHEPSLVDYTPYGGVLLTPAGEKMALQVIRNHRLLESYLTEALGFSWDEVHSEADRLEHFISKEMEERLSSALGHPAVDPHGDPIPDREGRYHLPAYQPLTCIAVGQTVQIRRVLEQEPEKLRYLAEIGLVLFVRLQVLQKAPFDGPVTIRLIDGPRTVHSLGYDFAQRLLVLPDSSPETEHL